MATTQEVGFGDLMRRLGVTADQLAKIDFRPALEVCARLIQNDTRERFRKGEDPDGKKWKPLKHPPKIPKGRSVDQPLWATGRLVASTGAGVADHVEELTPHSLVIGSSVQYAGYHQFGTKHIPARPFLGVGADLAKQLDDVVADFAVDAVVKSLGG
jgi:phage virion morphogenesis protein